MPDFGLLGYMFTTMAFQMQLVTMSINTGFGNTVTSDGQTVLAFIIIAFLFLLLAQSLVVEAFFAELVGNKVLSILGIIALIAGGICDIVAIAVYGSYSNTSNAPYEYLTYVTSLTAAFLAAVFLILSLCQCGKK
jgi:hypothetical protein